MSGAVRSCGPVALVGGGATGAIAPGGVVTGQERTRAIRGVRLAGWFGLASMVLGAGLAGCADQEPPAGAIAGTVSGAAEDSLGEVSTPATGGVGTTLLTTTTIDQVEVTTTRLTTTVASTTTIAQGPPAATTTVQVATSSPGASSATDAPPGSTSQGGSNVPGLELGATIVLGGCEIVVSARVNGALSAEARLIGVTPGFDELAKMEIVDGVASASFDVPITDTYLATITAFGADGSSVVGPRTVYLNTCDP